MTRIKWSTKYLDWFHLRKKKKEYVNISKEAPLPTEAGAGPSGVVKEEPQAELKEDSD